MFSAVAEVEFEDRRENTFFLDETPFQAVTLPFHIRTEYQEVDIANIQNIAHYTENGKAYCEVELYVMDGGVERYRVDTWENIITPDHQWMKWHGWMRVKSEFDD